MAINVTANISNVTVNTTSNVVTVSSTPVNVQLSATSVVSNASVRQAITVSNLSGYGNLTYDSSNVSNGVIQYTGVSTSDIRGSLSAASPITYNSGTGIIGLEQTLDDLTLKKYQETVVSHGNSSGNITLDLTNGTIHKYTLTGNVTKITPTNISAGGSATIILTQDNIGNNVLDTTTFPLEWIEWDFVNDFKSIDVGAGNYSILNILWDGTTYYASLVVDSEISPTTLNVSGNITGGNVHSLGVTTSVGNISTSADVSAVTLRGTGATGLVVNGNATIGGNLDVTGNINSETVVDLFVEDRNITMQYGSVGAPSANSQIFIDRGSSANTYIKWDESSDAWKFSNDGSTEYLIPTSTTDLAEGTNLYYTDGRADARIGAYTGALTPSTITASGNIDTATGINIAETSGANATLTLHANTSTTVYPNVVLYAPGMARMHNQPTAFATRLSPNGLEVNGLGDGNVTPTSNNFTVDLTELDFFAGNITGTDPIQVRVENTSDLTLTPSTDYDRGRLRINKQWSGSIATAMTDLLSYEDFQRASSFNVGGNLTLSGGAHLFGNSTITGAGAIDMTGDISSTTKIFTDGGANIEASGYLQSDTGVVTGGTITGNNLVANANVNAQIMIATGNIDGANINANYFHGDGSNLTGIAGDIESVVAGSGLTGGGTSGNVTLNVGAGTGITVNLDDIAVDMSAFTTTDLAEGTNLYYTDGRADARVNLQTGTNLDLSSKSTTDLAEGTNLYWTTTRGNTNSDAWIATKSTTDLAEGTNLYYTDARFNTAFTGKSTTDLSEGTNLYYTDARAQAALSVTTATASGDGSLTYNNATGVFTFTPADAGLSDYGDSNVVTLLSAFGSNTISSTANITTTANVNADHIISDSAQPLQLKGQTDGIALDKTISSAEARIVDFDTTGYSVADADFGSANVTTMNTPSIVIQAAGTAGTNTLTATLLFGGAFGPVIAGTQSVNAPYFYDFNIGAGAGLGPGMQASNSNLNLEGWALFDIIAGSSTSVLPINAHVTGISGNTITLSHNLTSNLNYGAPGYSVILLPGAYSSSQNIGLSLVGNTSVAGIPFSHTLPRYNSYDLPETLSNVTLDRVSYGDATVSMANVVMRHTADIKTGPDSAIRIPRAILVGANATPDLLSTSGALPPTTTLGITVEQDGVTDFGDVDTTPQMKFMMNNFTTNSLASYTTYPNWSQYVGQSGNASVDMPYLGSPNFNFKTAGGTKANTLYATAGDIPGRITWNALTLAVAGAPAGSDQFNPPASITAMVGGTGTLSSMANVDMYFQSTYPTSYRNGTTTAGGSIPRTFLSSKNGNTVLAAKSDGKITLRPVRDYGDASASTSYIDNRYAPNLHEYHEFLGAGFANTTTKAGTIVEVQSKSGQTNGNTSDFNYDSTGNSTLRLSTHNANTVVKTYWDITNENVGSNLQISQDGNDKVAIGDKETVFSHRVRFQNLTSAEILALTGMAAGDTVYNTTDNLLAYYDGTNWRNIAQGAIVT